jgi:XTP/dITP diphosphohydrolase
MTIVLATHNPHKRDELARVLRQEMGDLVEVKALDDLATPIGEIEETGVTLEENALIKARAVYSVTNLPVVADDTGLEVEILDGRPGVYSARYSGTGATYSSNIEKLLQELSGKDNRSAHFRTVIAYIDSQGKEHLFEGSVDGVITSDRRGEAGFGYDPVFQPVEDPEGRTFAEMSADEKNAVSHRARALRAFASYLRSKLT